MEDLPYVRTSIPGPLSRQLAEELRRYESPNVTYVGDRFPIFWERAQGCMVWDVDGNRFLDLTAAFGVSAVGHCHPHVVSAIQRQASTLIHGMGDVHPPALKVELARRLASISPEGLSHVIFGSDGSDAVEAAVKTAAMATSRSGVIAFDGAYHGLSYGALALTDRAHFRAPFEAQLGRFVRRAAYPGRDCSAEQSLSSVKRLLEGPDPPGAVVVEPILGRGGIRVPPEGWFTRLSEICRSMGALLIADEIFTGCGRTGRWFASETPPDLLCVGKAMGGGLPIAACIGTEEVMSSWGESTGEAIHTSTFLGHPLGCAAALATVETIEADGLIARCAAMGERLRRGFENLGCRHPLVADVRGRGLMLGIELRDGDDVPCSAVETTLRALERGLIVLPAGPLGNVVELTPPFVITEEQIDYALAALAESIAAP